MNLLEELTQKQVLKFQVNKEDKKFLTKTIFKNKEGIFNLSSEINEEIRENILKYLQVNKNYEFYMKNQLTNYEIAFRRLN